MKLISLNLWGGKIYEPLIAFFEKYKDEIDVFCLQEMFSTTSEETVSDGARVNLLQELTNLLADFTPYYAPEVNGYDFSKKVEYDISFGDCMFVKKTVPILSDKVEFVFRWENAVEKDFTEVGRTVQYVQTDIEKNTYILANFHGLWNGGGKTDTPDRISQSENIRKVLDPLSGKKILAGDFNLLPDTESLKILEQGYRNLIKDHNITSTRSHLYDKENKFADYILVTPDVEVKEFKVLEDVVSDHLPLLLEFA